MQKRNFVTRTIRNGKVKIFHKIFVPSDKWLEYDGLLDGSRVVFGLYWNGDKWDDNFIYLWGTEENFNMKFETDEEYQKWLETEINSTFGLVDNYYPWAWWWQNKEE